MAGEYASHGGGPDLIRGITFKTCLAKNWELPLVVQKPSTNKKINKKRFSKFY